MGSLHWLLLIAFYFFAALNTLLLLMVGSRVLRARATINPLAVGAVLFGIVAVALPVLTGWARLADYTGARLLFLILASFALAAVDGTLALRLSLPLDKELEEL